jgi:hypothetical protein
VTQAIRSPVRTPVNEEEPQFKCPPGAGSVAYIRVGRPAVRLGDGGSALHLTRNGDDVMGKFEETSIMVRSDHDQRQSQTHH